MKKTICVSLSLLTVLCCLLLSGCKGGNKTPYDYNLDEYITLPEYQTITVNKESNDYKMGLEYTNYSNLSALDGVITTTTLSEGTVQILDTAVIDYVGKKNGVAFEGGTASGHELLIGSSSFIDGFESGLIGAKVGQTLDLNLTFPENYGSEELAGQAVVFTVTVNEIIRPTMPELTDELANQLGYDSVAVYRTEMELSYLSNYVWNNFVNQVAVLKYPQAEVDEYVERYLDGLKSQAEANGMTVDSLLSANGLTLKQYRETLTEQYAKPRVVQNMTAFSIARKENIEATEEEVDQYIAESYPGMTLDEKDRQDLLYSLLTEKVITYLTDNVKD